jgi:hypothetical protein
MKSMMLISAALCGLSLGQGNLNPPGSPAPTMKSLQEIWDKAVNLEAQNLAQQQQISALTQKNNEQNAYLGVSLPWKLASVSVGGAPNSLAFGAGGQPSISFYDAGSQDLKYAAFDGSAWQITTVDSAGSVGIFNSLAFSSSGHPAIAYYDASNGDLKYADFDGAAWQVATVDSGGDVGTHVSLKMSTSGLPAIGYRDAATGSLKFATSDGTTWTTSVVDLTSGGSVSLAFSHTGYPAIAYTIGPADGIKYGEFNGTAWSLTDVYIGQPFEDTDAPSLAFSATGQPHVAYEVYEAPARIYLAKRTSGLGSSWSRTMIPSAVISASDWGFHPSLAFTSDGQPAMSVTLDPNIQGVPNLPILLYLYFDGTDWKSVTVDASPKVGYSSSLAFTPGGQPAISYYDKTNGKIKYAVRSVFQNP